MATKTHAALGGSTATSGGPTFADVLSSSYGLALNDFRGADDSSPHGDMGSGSGHGHFSHGQDSGYSQSETAAGGSAASTGAPSSGGGGNNSSFCDSLDTFHAEFITQPIDYPMDVSPPPPIPLQEATSAPQGSPTCHPPHPPMSPSLPSFLDTYRHPTLEEQQASRYTFKQEPSVTPPNSGSGSSYVPPSGIVVSSSSSYSSHVYQQQTHQQQQQHTVGLLA